MENRFVETGEGLVWSKKKVAPTDRERKIVLASIKASNEGRSIADVMDEENLS